MASRATIRTWLRSLLGTSSDDPAFTDAILDPLLQQSVDVILQEITDSNPAYLSKTVTLIADSTTSRNYTFATQNPAIADFSKWLEVRYTDQDGAEFDHARLEELDRAGSSFFDIIGPDDTAVLVTSPDTTVGHKLWMRYAYWPAVLVDDNSVPSSIPSRFHDVVALECLFAFALGGEARRPPELRDRWLDRKAQLLAHVGRRGVAPARTRLSADWRREA